MTGVFDAPPIAEEAICLAANGGGNNGVQPYYDNRNSHRNYY